MRYLGFLILLLFVAYCYSEEQYSTQYDNTDFVAILKDETKLRGYIMCLLDEGLCTPDGKYLKDVLPEAIATNCKKCSAHQRKFAKISAHFLMKNFPKEWEMISKKFDPENKYQTSFKMFLEEKEV